MLTNTLSTAVQQKQVQVLGQQQLQGLGILALSLPELRAEVQKEIAANPALEDIDHPLETSMQKAEEKKNREDEELQAGNVEEDFVPQEKRYDEEAVERHEAILNSQTRAETLQEHLLAQLPLSDIPRTDWPLVEVLVGDIDHRGAYTGSLPDACMAFGKSVEEIEAVLAEIRGFDPAGCGWRTVQECLLAQLDKLEDPLVRGQARYLIENRLPELAAGKVDLEKYGDAVRAIRTLAPHPGSAFPSERDRPEYVNPEVHTVRGEDGHWYAVTDERSLPEIHISKKFQEMLANPDLDPETRKYVTERIESAKDFRKMIKERQQTVKLIAQEIYDRQQDFFTKGFAALRPLTELEIAEVVGVSGPTVSRTVCDKYADTPQGVIELRKFFSTVVKTADGGELSQAAAKDELKRIVASEDTAAPFSDEKLAALLKEKGFPVARRTVAKYRDQLGIPGTSKRRMK